MNIIEAVRIAAARKLRAIKTTLDKLGGLPPFVQHHNPAANARRKVKAAIGARQYRKQRKALAREARNG